MPARDPRVFKSEWDEQEGRVTAIVGAVKDISERKRAEEAVAAEKERLAVTLSSIGDGVITTDITGDVVLMNRIAEELTGWTQNEARGKPLATVFSIRHEATRETCESPVEKVLSTGRVAALPDHVILASYDGTERAIANSGAPIRDGDGKTIGVVLVFRDVTEKQKTLEAVQRAARLDSLGVLAGGIAHDFNNLLSGIFGHIDLARSLSKDLETTECLEATLATMDRARALTMQLLTFAKGGAPVQRTTELIPFLRDAVRFALSGSRISCQFALAQGLWACSIDKNQIGQVIDNIVINAQQAMPDGGGIEMAAENVSREEGGSCLASGRYVRVSIRDFGVGIPAEVLPRIFDPFFTTKPRGHGLGLATCYSIVKRHGGFIEVESEPGKGSAFHVYLPASSETVGANQASTVTRKGIGKIIVVDDEEVVRTTLRRMLEVLGYSVLCKSDGRDGIAAYINETKAGEPFVAMILDLTVPGGMGGVETVAEMRKLNKEMPIFVSSGYADDCVMRNPADYGFTASISKPFTIAELSEMLGGNLKS